jgi:hypothetical protein
MRGLGRAGALEEEVRRGNMEAEHMRTMQRGLLLLPVVLALLSALGCTKGYHYELSCVVKNVADGKPLPGVKAILDTFGEQSDLSYGQPVDQPTDAEGRLTDNFFVTIIAFDPGRPRWYLKLQKEGFFPEVVDIKPALRPEKTGSTTPLIVVVYLRPKEQQR